MTALTRSPYDDNREGWHVYFHDVRIGSIARFTGVPLNGNQWGCSLGFYPGMPTQMKGGRSRCFCDPEPSIASTNDQTRSHTA